MRSNNYLIGSSKNCNKSCIQNSKQMFSKNHNGQHVLMQKSQIKSQINDFLQQRVGRVFQKKSQILREYFRDLREKIHQVQQITTKQFNNIRYQVAIQSDKSLPLEKINSYSHLIEDIRNDNFQQMSCSKIESFMKDLQRLRKISKSQIINVNYEKMNKILREVKNQTENAIQKLIRRHTNRMQKIDENQRDHYNQKIQKQRVRTQRDKKQQNQVKIPLTLILQAPKQSQFAVRVKVQRIKSVIQSKPNKRILFLGSDSSGKIDFFVFKHQYISQGNTIIIEKCKIKYHNGKKQIGSNCMERGFTLISRAEDRSKNQYNQKRKDSNRFPRQKDNQRGRIKVQESQRTIRQQRPPRRDRYDEQRPRQKQRNKQERIRQKVNANQKNTQRGNQKQKNQQTKKQSKLKYHHEIQQQNIIKIQSIQPGAQNLIIQVKIIKIQQNQKGLNCVLGDETGIVKALLPAHWDDVVKGNCVRIKKLIAEVQQQHIILLPQKDAKIKKSLKNIDKIKLDYNISDYQWATVDE